MVSFVHQSVNIDESVLERAEAIQSMGFDSYDALHLSCAEAAQVDVFLTTDDRIVQLAGHSKISLKIHIANPLSWLEEITE